MISFKNDALAITITAATLLHSIALTGCQTNAAEPIAAGTETIDSVTLYRDQATVMRQIDVPASTQLQQIRVTDLPESYVDGTAFSQCESGSVIRSTRVMTVDSLSPENEQKVKTLADQYASLVRDLNNAQQSSTVIEQDLITLEKLVDFSASKTLENLDRATLDVRSVTALTDFTMQRRRQLARELHEQQIAIEDLTKAIQVNRASIESIHNTRGKTSEALIEVISADGGPLRFSYQVSDAGWSPSYTVRGKRIDQKTAEFAIEFKSVIVQNSGEDWNDVKLTLSTAQPDLHSAGPGLTPLRIGIAESSASSSSRSSSMAPKELEIPSWQDQMVWHRDITRNAESGMKQIAELEAPAEIKRDIAIDAGSDISDESYKITDRIKIPSRLEHQTVAVTRDTLPGDLNYVVTPLLSSFAFREADLKNTIGRNMIAGDADIYLDENFIGKTTLPPTAAGQRFRIGFGADRQVRTRRELMSRDSSVHGGNQRVAMKYRLVVSNYHDTVIPIRLLDRIPLAMQNESVSVTLATDTANQLSTDPLYLRMQRPTGILRWDLEIPAERFGSDAFDFEYQFTIELDREKRIVGDRMFEQMRSDYRFENTGGGGFGGGMGGMGGGSF
ncbi:hypothetical protein RMSM_07416 [Rhodopirellula maiorica SM1]|uniref:Mucoidy inhibitor MuiA family protein n=1 Tax=Rhodopirellula maiorica SM1 TaxID=1265738 RepID=M5R9C3_9BACT|nr:DUF4139 domain-containing protein [Rhodopirellula maiorica]EMI15651.1 hypothetical protein RMSM_07416 [Rhodopirellula maiorica SM1]